MARTALTAASLPLATGASYFPTSPLVANSADLAFTAADPANGNYVPLMSGKTRVLVKNVHGTTAFTMTIRSVADERGRLGDITNYSVSALVTSSFGPFLTTGWNQASPAGLWIDSASTNLQFAVELLP